jgi:serine/threonine protein kinase
MIASGTEVKIADFGAAVLKKSQVVQTAALGSPYYMSPEAIQGKSLTFHSDMYSIGVVLYELLTGQRPFSGANLEALMAQILKASRRRRARCARSCRSRSTRVVLRAMKKGSGAALPTWPEFALELAKAGELVLPPGSIPDSEKYVTLKKVPMLSASPIPSCGSSRAPATGGASPRATWWCRRTRRARASSSSPRAKAKVTKKKKLLNMLNSGEYFGEMAYIGGGEQAAPRLGRGDERPAAGRVRAGGARPDEPRRQLQLTRALVRNVTDRPCPRQRQARPLTGKSSRRRPGWRGC